MALRIKAGRFIGQILVDGGFVSSRDLHRALEEQKSTNELLGQVLTRMGVVDPADLKVALSVQDHLASLKDAVKMAAGMRRMLGALLLQAGHINEAQLEEALAEQKRTGEKLGDVFVRLGFLSKRQLDALLDFQRVQGATEMAAGPLRLGDILVSAGHLSRGQLQDALKKQKISRKKLGEILVDEGYVQLRQVKQGICLQQKLLTAVLSAILAFTAVHDADAGKIPASRSGGAELRVSATVLPFAALKVSNRSQVLRVTEADISRGYIDVSEGSSIEVRSNSRDGYYLSFECFESAVKQVRVDGLGKPAVFGGGSGVVPMSMDARMVSMQLSYRFILSDEIHAGVYPWPLTVAVTPM
ncbi:repeat-containing protein [Syntrophotalea carbinolica DSM 2380]|uniref:Repeat-containing protein n=1 Tax=Syntrophotalea carbinolica (strain DSM 2380 / NBRC 103641 / GraBd1) TaxID=338963 RepID=Q3A2V5_SYNC1|nr:hypothetical protein [Syntrophotalea carbinolica]ABA89302.1 repeat-containing protein [Syntrophotalea carbinolica DSM 2380]